MNDFEKCFCGKCGKKYFKKLDETIDQCPWCGGNLGAPDASDVRQVKREFERSIGFFVSRETKDA